jgi:ATP-dependent exoDNAse (exonuclease V) alpha subunit
MCATACAIVTDVDPSSGSVRVRTDRGTEHDLPREYVKDNLDHAYALTVHAAQGTTVSEAYVLASDASRLAEWGYVALSRARDRTHIYVLDTTQARDLSALEPPTAKPTIDDLAAGLGRPAAEPMALDQLPRHRPPPVPEIDM